MKKRPIVPSNTNNNKNSFEIKPQKFELLDFQQEIIKTGLDKSTKCLILDACAGVSKTYLAIYIGLILLQQKKIPCLTYIRTSVQSKDGQLGFLGGDLSMKTDWMNEPLFEKLEEFLDKPTIDKLAKEGKIQTLPSCMIRGRGISGIVIFDEIQNSFWSTIESVLTRLNEHSLAILCGDSSGSQNDLGSQTGIHKLVSLFNDQESKDNGIFYFKMGSECIVRSKFVKFLIQKIEKANKNSKIKN